ncbi:TPA: hypothetical protein KOR49_002355 [Clostridioides difficile]|uniref:Uncharacterized protein n=1 Tax=Clostridioides difficile TaxID=1496 RepID=A0AAN5VPU7_CLODI|nr:hypothetical protein [Clostridioides difficile]EGT3944942.1 hypothetical protein [Clostridioides difficile]MBG0198883.1 hypothetical protein [Clostridioides difficile]MCA0574549.1 hypothetical protein [Clostridioides difficile]MDW0076854.1 hypothetical protein [Clostridioides difficile]PBG30513.1 hypothetical protein BGU81_02595 [Clostridioides difficile]
MNKINDEGSISLEKVMKDFGCLIAQVIESKPKTNDDKNKEDSCKKNKLNVFWSEKIKKGAIGVDEIAELSSMFNIPLNDIYRTIEMLGIAVKQDKKQCVEDPALEFYLSNRIALMDMYKSNKENLKLAKINLIVETTEIYKTMFSESKDITVVPKIENKKLMLYIYNKNIELFLKENDINKLQLI